MSQSDAETQIQDEPLGDASEVYEREINAETSFRMENDGFRAYDEDNSEAIIRVDDIYNGEVALVTFTATHLESGTCSKLSPSQARMLANVLLRAADYAEDQQ